MKPCIAGSIVCFVCLSSGACHHTAAPEAPPSRIQVRCEAVETRRWAETRTLRGTVAARPDRDAVVSSQVAGRLLHVRVREGDTVPAGAALADVEPEPLRDALRQSEALLVQARAQRNAAASAALRERHLFERGIHARQTYELAQAALGQAEGSVALATAQVDVARRNLARATVRAPLAGVVLRLLRREGEVVDGTPATPIVQIADPNALELAAGVGAADLVALRAGQPARVTFDAIPGLALTGHVVRLAPSVDTATGVGSVRIALDTAGRSLPMGILARAEVETSPPRPVPVVPMSAIRNAGGAHTELVLCDGGRAHPLPVVTGARREGFVEIVEGLPAATGARVVVDGLVGLEEGARIEEVR